MTNFDNNKDKVCSLLKDDIGGSRVRSPAKLYVRSPPKSCVRSHDHRSYDHGITFKIKNQISNIKFILVLAYWRVLDYK